MEREIDLLIIAKKIWEARKKIIWAAIAGGVFGIIIALSIPKIYTSAVTVAPEKSSMTGAGGSIGAIASMMGGDVATSKDAINEKLYPEIISSTPFILEFADIPITYNNQKMTLSQFMLENQKKAWWKYIIIIPAKTIEWISKIGSETVDTLTIKNSPAIQYAFAAQMNGAIEVTADIKNGTIIITSSFQTPEVAKIVSDSLIVKLQKYVTKYKTAKTKSNLESNTRMLAEAKHHYYILDEEFAKIFDRNQNIISKTAQIRVDRTEQERNLAYQLYQQLATQVASDQIKLQEEIPIVAVIEPSTTPINPSAPKKMIVTCAFIFLFGAFATGKIIVKELLNAKINN